MSVRTKPPGLTTTLRDVDRRIKKVERLQHLSGTVSVGSLRIGDFVLEQVGSDLVARSLLPPFTTSTVLAGP